MPVKPEILARLPSPACLRELMQALATLDAILSPEWEYRYYSFNDHWDASESMGSMRNGQGDDLFVLFNASGAFIKGLDHQRAQAGRSPIDLYARVPALFSSAVVEPAFSPEYVTFCCWRAHGDEVWDSASIALPGEDGDGSDWLLAGLDGDPQTYVMFAQDYYETHIDVEAVSLVYRRAPMTPELARRLNPTIDFHSLRSDLEEIGYPVRAN